MCKNCKQRFIGKPDDKFCCKDCENMWYDIREKQIRRAGRGKAAKYPKEWEAIINIMKEHNCQYPKAVEIYERRKENETEA